MSCLERWSIKLEHLDSLSPSFLTLGQGLSASAPLPRILGPALEGSEGLAQALPWKARRAWPRPGSHLDMGSSS